METIKLNITQLNTIIKRIIDAEEFLRVISVYGEVTNFKISAGNAYFDIKEEGASLSCIFFGASNLTIKNGDMVLLTGRLNYYVKTGKLSFIASKVEEYGLGELYKQFLLLKERLGAEGLFDEEIKKEIPRFAKKVGVVTSETGAVIRDIVHVAKKKNKYTDIIVYPARVQGEKAEDEIIAGLNYFENTDVDVVIIARGGGSFEDLAPFNTEKLVRAIYACKKPIISAVGHETDFSLSDFASDMRAPTPSVAAEIAFFDYEQTLQNLNDVIKKIIEDSSLLISSKQEKIKAQDEQILNQIQNIIGNNYLLTKSAMSQVLSNYTLNIEKQKSNLNKLTAVIEKSNPMNILKAGYSITEKDGKKINSIESVDIGDNVKITLTDGSIDAIVKSKEKK